MVLIGAALGSAAGSMGGRALAKKYLGNDYANEGATIGGLLGGAAGALTPFKNGGLVKKTGKAYLHKGELVIPANMVKDVSKTLKKKIKKNGGRNMK